MIKLQQHLDENPVSAAASLATLLNNHWVFLNPFTVRKPVRLTKTALINRCENAQHECTTLAFRTKHGLTKTTAERLRRFFVGMLNNDSSLLKDVVLSEPTDLISRVHPILEKLLPNRILYTEKNGVQKQTSLGRYLSEEIFDYGRFRSSQYCPRLYNQGMNGNLYTCPYCNLNPVTVTRLPQNASLGTTQKAYLDIDHFFPKVRFPYFAVSFYNLIPSCHDCNAGEKGSKPFLLSSHIHPYVDSFDDMHEFRLNSVALISGEVVIECRARATARPDKTVHDLNLIERYNVDTQTATAVLEYYKANLRTLRRHHHIHSKFFFSHFPLRSSHILRKQRAKLLRDIFAQIGGTVHFPLE